MPKRIAGAEDVRVSSQIIDAPPSRPAHVKTEFSPLPSMRNEARGEWNRNRKAQPPSSTAEPTRFFQSIRTSDNQRTKRNTAPAQADLEAVNPMTAIEAAWAKNLSFLFHARLATGNNRRRFTPRIFPF